MLLNLHQTAEKLGVSETSVKRLVEAGSLPAVPYGNPDAKRKAFRFNESDITAFRRARIHQQPEVPKNNNGHAVLPPTAPPTASAPDGYVHTVQASKMLDWTYQRTIDMVKNGRLDSKMIGNRRFIALADIEKAKAWPKTGPMRSVKPAVTTEDVQAQPDAPTPSPSLGLTIAGISRRLTETNARCANIEKLVAEIHATLDTLVKAFS